MMKRTLIAASLLLCCFIGQAQPKISGPADTTMFKQSDFQWHITPRYDYSQTLMGKLFLSQALWDEKYKLRDNGKQTVCMDCGQAMDAIKAMDAITMGLPKIIYLVGWQYNGHDSKYPAFFECNEAIKKPGDANAHESILNVMEEAKKYHTAVSLHINMFACFEDSPLFEKYKKDDVLARYEDGSYVHSDWGWAISYARDWATGNAQARLDKLCNLFPISDAGSLHIDYYYSVVPVPVMEGNDVHIRFMSPISPYHHITKEQEIDAQLKIIKYLDAKGIDVTSEFVPDEKFIGYMPAVWHKHEKYLYLTRTESQMGHTNAGDMGNVFGRNVNSESAFRYGGDTMAEKAETFKKEFCKNSVPYLYLGRHTAISYIKSQNSSDAEAQFTDGVTTYYIDKKFSLYKDDINLVDGGNVFLPTAWVGGNVVVAYSDEGYENRVWTLPSEITPKGYAKAYTVDAEGQHYVGKVKVRNRKVTLSLTPGEMLKLEF